MTKMISSVGNAVKNGADDCGKIQRSDDAVVVDQQRDHEFDEFLEILHRFERGFDAVERDGEITFAAFFLRLLSSLIQKNAGNGENHR